MKRPIFSILIILVAISIGYFIYSTETNKDSSFKFKLGLDLAGGTQLTYRADTAALEGADVGEAMESLRDVIERRVNLFGVSEPVVTVQKGSGGENRLSVELPGITNIKTQLRLLDSRRCLSLRRSAPRQIAMRSLWHRPPVSVSVKIRIS